MNHSAEPIEVLNARQHREYLAAMAVDWWIPKDQAVELEAISPLASVQDMTIKVDASVKTREPQASTDSHRLKVQTDSKQEPGLDQEPTEEQGASPAHQHAGIQTNNPSSESMDIDISQLCFSTNQALKMVNWQSAGGDLAKKLLIICRHKTDQPANSFAQKDSPSHFMQSYISALSRFNSNSAAALAKSNAVNDFCFHLAHLAEAGIGNNNQQLEDVLHSLKPDLILVLGEESILQLSGQSIPLAQLRGRFIEMQGFKALVSYHPYSLIKNPALKANAYEDLVLIFQYLSGLTA